MMRPGLQLGELQLAQPFADGAFRYRDREAPGYFSAKIDTAPTDDFVDLAIRTGDNERAQLSHLRRGQFGGCPGCLARYQAVDAGLIITMHPVTQGLAVHTRLTRGIKP